MFVLAVDAVAVNSERLLAVSKAPAAVTDAQVLSPLQNVPDVAPVPELRLVTGRLPVTPPTPDAAKLAAAAVPVVFWFSVGNVQLVSTPALGVPMFGVVSTGLVANTLAPDPVSSERAAASCAEVKLPSTAALPEDVT